MLKEKVRELLEDALRENESLFLIDFVIQGSNHIRVTIDGDTGVTVADCIAVSRAIEHNLDREEEDFSLDVMSAGISEGLKQKRQYRKNIDRTLAVKTSEREIQGKLIAVNEEGITLSWKAREPKVVGKGKVTVKKEQNIAFDAIIEAKVMITFN